MGTLIVPPFSPPLSTTSPPTFHNCPPLSATAPPLSTTAPPILSRLSHNCPRPPFHCLAHSLQPLPRHFPTTSSLLPRPLSPATARNLLATIPRPPHDLLTTAPPTLSRHCPAHSLQPLPRPLPTTSSQLSATPPATSTTAHDLLATFRNSSRHFPTTSSRPPRYFPATFHCLATFHYCPAHSLPPLPRPFSPATARNLLATIRHFSP